MRLTLSPTSCTVLPHMLGMRIARCIGTAVSNYQSNSLWNQSKKWGYKKVLFKQSHKLAQLPSNSLKMRLTLSLTNCTVLPHMLGLPIAKCIEAAVEISKQLSLEKKTRTEVTKKVLLQQSHKLARLPSNSFDMRLTSSQINCSVLHRMPGLPISSCIEATFEVTMQPLLVTKQRLKWLNI